MLIQVEISRSLQIFWSEAQQGGQGRETHPFRREQRQVISKAVRIVRLAQRRGVARAKSPESTSAEVKGWRGRARKGH